jgi:hypothetical protein
MAASFCENRRMAKHERQRPSYDLDTLKGGGWVLWATNGPRPQVAAEGRVRLVGWLVYWHRRWFRSRPPPPPQPRSGLELID